MLSPLLILVSVLLLTLLLLVPPHQVLELQLQVEKLTAQLDNDTVGLEDICFQPLAPDHTECTIQSVLNYFQNNATQLDRKIMDQWGFYTLADYLDHFMYCVK